MGESTVYECRCLVVLTVIVLLLLFGDRSGVLSSARPWHVSSSTTAHSSTSGFRFASLDSMPDVCAIMCLANNKAFALA